MNIGAVNGSVPLIGQIYKDQASGESFQAALEAAARRDDADQLHKACEGFESYFLQILFREMRKPNLNAGGIFSKSSAENIFEDMLYEEYSKAAAKKGGIGLADMVYRQLSGQIKN